MEKKKQFLMKQKEHLNRGKRGVLSVIFGRTGILLMLILLQIGLLLVGFRFRCNYIFCYLWLDPFFLDSCLAYI